MNPRPGWHLETGEGPLVACAIHAGRRIREELVPHLRISDEDRLREEDPFTDLWVDVAPNRVVVETSRFQQDLNRPRETAVYLTPEDAWGLEVWTALPPREAIERSLKEYDDFYADLSRLFGMLEERYGRFLVLDLHSYNHRRQGPGTEAADPQGNPQVNVGTGTMRQRSRFAPVIDTFIETLAKADFPGGPLDVRENVKFRGGQFARWAHETFPDGACVLSIEFKKFFMDEWTGRPDTGLLDAIHRALGETVGPALRALGELDQ